MPLITFEGLDGAGKTSVIDALQRQLEGTYPVFRLSDFSLPPTVRLKPAMVADPEPLRRLAIVLHARILTHSHVLQHHLRRSTVVLYDRYLDSTLAYQGAEGLCQKIMTDMHAAKGLPLPDLTLVLDIPVTVMRARKRTAADRIEARPDHYFADVRQRFLNLVKDSPRHVVVDATQPLEVVTATCIAAIQARVFNLQEK